MNRTLYPTTFAVGLTAIAWVGVGYIPGNPQALAMVVLIGAFYLMGALELHHYRRAHASLAQAVSTTAEPPATLQAWLAQLHPSLQDLVRLRAQGERVALPGPALTPYLVGLLVLLGMLGTFLGMVLTLQGTGAALENASDVEAIRSSLAAPVRGLGLAFGTSVAGVAASAALGLMSTLARRERQAAAQQLDTCLAGTLRGFSRAQHREETLRLLQMQTDLMAGTLPTLATQLRGLLTQMAHEGQALHERLQAGQAQFHGQVQQAYGALAQSVDQSLKTSLSEAARLAGQAIEPAVQATLAGLAHEAGVLHRALGDVAQEQLQAVSARLESSTTALLQGVAGHLDSHARQAIQAWERALLQQRQSQAALREDLQQDLADRQQQICTTLANTAQAIALQSEAQARATIAEASRLLQTAAAAPRAAAEVIGELRQALSASLARDNAALDERNRLLATLAGLLEAVNHANGEQRAAIDALVQATSGLLGRSGERFAQTVEAESRSLRAVAAQVQGGAAEVASLGEGFGQAVRQFSRTSDALMGQLQRIESALAHSLTRSDEQLAYYLAQAREIVDLTLGSHRQIVQDLQQLGKPSVRSAALATGPDGP